MPLLEQFLTVALLTPIFNPLRHKSPRDLTVLWGVPVNLVGKSGLAKTARIKQVCAAAGIPSNSVYVPTKQPEDFTGAYVPTPDGLAIECVLPAARMCIERGGGCIHLSELSSARAAVQAALLSVVSERQVGDHLLPPKTRFLVDMNPPEYAAGGYALEPPMANRLAHYDYPTPTAQEFGNFLTGQAEDTMLIKDGEEKVCQNWNAHWPSVVGLMRGFLRSSPMENIVNQPKPDNPNSGGAWPSLRTWHYALCAITTVRCLNMNRSLELELVKSLVGKGATKAWATWVKNTDLPNPHDMLTNGWEPDRKHLDKTYASLTALSEYMKGLEHADRPNALVLAPAAWNILHKTMKNSMADLVPSPAKNLIHARLGIENTPNDVYDAAEKVIFELTEKGYVGMVAG